MENFTETTEQVNPASTLPLISHGLPFSIAISKHMNSTLTRKRAYIIISSTLAHTTDALARLEKELGTQMVGIRKGMTPHTLYSEVMEVARDVKKTQADILVTIGGGSLVDAAKAISFLLANENIDLGYIGDMDKLFKDSMVLRTTRVRDAEADKGDIKESVIPIVCIPTTLSAGEYNSAGGATNDETRHKQLFQDPENKAPKVLIWDPELCTGVPARVWLSSGLRAVDHCVETICSSNPKMEGTEWSITGLKFLLPALLEWKRKKNEGDGSDMGEVIVKCFKGGRCSMMAFLLHGVHVGGSHGIGHQLGPYGVPHAETTCVLLPAVQRFNATVSHNKEAQRIISDIFWSEPSVAEVLAKRGLKREQADLADCLDAVIRELGFPRCLKQYGVKSQDLEKIAESSLGDVCSTWNVISLVRNEQVMEILNASMEDEETDYVPEFC